jgi:DNA-binding transcriptional ArsR family regulator
MADAGGERAGRGKPRKKADRRSRRTSRARRRIEEARRRAALISAIAHPLRRRILRLLAGGAERSPAEAAEEFELGVGGLSYHFNVLRRLGAVKPVREQMVRGAVEHFYASAIEDDAPIETLLEETRAADEEAA